MSFKVQKDKGRQYIFSLFWDAHRILLQWDVAMAIWMCFCPIQWLVVPPPFPDGQISVFSIPDKFGTNFPTPERWKTSLVWAGNLNQESRIGCTRRPEPHLNFATTRQSFGVVTKKEHEERKSITFSESVKSTRVVRILRSIKSQRNWESSQCVCRVWEFTENWYSLHKDTKAEHTPLFTILSG